MQNNVKLLLVILLLLVAASYFVLQDKNLSLSDETQMLIPELQDLINEVDGIVISKNDKSISLNKQEGVWRIAEVDNFMADTNKIATLLLDLRRFSLKEKKTTNPKNYPKLSLAESGDDSATKITLKNASGQFADISLGKQAIKSQGTYVRKNLESQVWLSDGILNLKLDSSFWIVTTILDVDSSAIKSVTFKPAESAAFIINKLTPVDQSFVLENIPTDMQVQAGVDLNSLANGLKNFNIESVAEKSIDHDEKIVISVIYQLFSGMTYQLDLFEDGEKHQLSISLANIDSNSHFDIQLENWRFDIPSYKFDALNKKLSELIESKAIESAANED